MSTSTENIDTLLLQACEIGDFEKVFELIKK